MIAKQTNTILAKQQILNKLEQMIVTREELGKHVPSAMDKGARIKGIVEKRWFLFGPCQDVINKGASELFSAADFARETERRW
jgi:hypothetical protein